MDFLLKKKKKRIGWTKKQFSIMTSTQCNKDRNVTVGLNRLIMGIFILFFLLIRISLDNKTLGQAERKGLNNNA